jgi:hypothetical protein
VPKTTFDPTRDKALIGAAGVHFVVSEPSVRGLIALPTIRNTAGMDVVAVKDDNTWNIQVKTSRSRVNFWPIGNNCDKWNGPNNYYVFVRYLKDSRRFEAFLESSALVIKQVAKRVADEKARGLKPWSPCWYLDGEEDRLRLQWQEFGNSETS